MDPVYLNGRFLPEDEARLPAGDPGRLLGLGVFETFRARYGTVYRLESHYRRLGVGAATLGIEVPIDLPHVAAAVADLAQRCRLDDARVRLTFTAVEADAPNILIQARANTDYPPETYKRGISLLLVPQRRNESSPLSRFKAVSYAENILARRQAQEAGADEALLLNSGGLVAEGATTNIFAVIEGTVVTPPVEDGAMPGVTREAVLELAPASGLRAEVRSLTPEELAAADEVFATNAVAGLLPVVTLDGRVIGSGRPGAITKRLLAAYEAAVGAVAVPGAAIPPRVPNP
jgi:branched-chain amino acid aminotransferase